MGGIQSSCQKIVNIVKANDPVLNVRISGLEGSGKSSIINYIKYGKTSSTEEMEEESNKSWIMYEKYKLVIWKDEFDLSKVVDSEEKEDESHSNAIIYVIDGTDEQNFLRAKENLGRVLEHTRLTPELLVLINKCDDPTCASLEELYALFEINKITDRHVHVQQTSALTGEGIKNGFDWLCKRFEVKNGEYINRKGKRIKQINYIIIQKHYNGFKVNPLLINNITYINFKSKLI